MKKRIALTILVAATLVSGVIYYYPFQQEVMGAGVAAIPNIETRELVTGFEMATTSHYVWNALVGTPTVIANGTYSTNGNTDNDWSVQLNPTANAEEYLEWNVTSVSTSSAHFSVAFSSFPTTDTEIFSFYNITNAERQCFIEMDGESNRLKVYHEDTIPECASSFVDGTPCDPDGDVDTQCPAEVAGVSSCSEPRFAQSQGLVLNTWYEVYIENHVPGGSNGDVTCSLYIDGFSKGSATRPQGFCTGGTDAGEACSDNDRCAGGGSCTIPDDVAQSEVVRFGSFSTTSPAWTGYFDDIVIANVATTSLVNLRIQDIVPTADFVVQWSRNNCDAGKEYDCVNDLAGTSAANDNTDYLSGPAAGAVSNYQLENITLGTGESIHGNFGVGISTFFRNQGGAAPGSDKAYVVNLATGLATTTSHEFDISNALTLDYFPEIYTVASTTEMISLATSTRETMVNSFVGGMQRVGSAGTVRVTAQTFEVEISTPQPLIPSTLSDQNADGEITVCVIADSKYNDPELYENLSAFLSQPENIYDCSTGGVKSQDLVNDFTDLLNGTADGTIDCTVAKGSIGSKCDYAFLEIGVNDFGGNPTIPVGGRCIGGTNNGNNCAIPSGHPDQTGHQLYPLVGNKGYCSQGADQGDACNTAGDCTDAPTGASINSCDVTSATSNWCVRGDNTVASCPGGFCADVSSIGYVANNINMMVDEAKSRSGSDAVKLILMGHFRTANNIVQSPFFSLPCFAEERTGDAINNINSYVLALAAEESIDWIDMKTEMWQKCDANNYENCLRDSVHLSTDVASTLNNAPNLTITGNEVAAQVIAACLLQDESLRGLVTSATSSFSYEDVNWSCNP